LFNFNQANRRNASNLANAANSRLGFLFATLLPKVCARSLQHFLGLNLPHDEIGHLLPGRWPKFPPNPT
jgi:hypothetical protein